MLHPLALIFLLTSMNAYCFPEPEYSEKFSNNEIALRIALAEQFQGEVAGTAQSFGSGVSTLLQNIQKPNFDSAQDPVFRILKNETQFFSNLVLRSRLAQRYKLILAGSEALNPLTKSDLEFIHLVQVLHSLPQEQRMETFRRYLTLHSPLYLSHPELARISNLFSPAEHRLLIFLLFSYGTQLVGSSQFYPPGLLRLESGLDISQISISDYWDYWDSFITLRHHLTGSQQLNYLSKLLKKVKCTKYFPLMEFLRSIPTECVLGESEKCLLDLRDRMRKGTGNSLWTAADLFHMQVPLNIALFIKAISVCQEYPLSETELTEVKNIGELLVESSEMKNIEINPDKPKLDIPAKRGVSLESIESFLNSQVKALGEIL